MLENVIHIKLLATCLNNTSFVVILIPIFVIIIVLMCVFNAINFQKYVCMFVCIYVYMLEQAKGCNSKDVFSF